MKKTFETAGSLLLQTGGKNVVVYLDKRLHFKSVANWNKRIVKYVLYRSTLG
jgi:hypothetical protein